MTEIAIPYGAYWSTAQRVFVGQALGRHGGDHARTRSRAVPRAKN